MGKGNPAAGRRPANRIVESLRRPARVDDRGRGPQRAPLARCSVPPDVRGGPVPELNPGSQTTPLVPGFAARHIGPDREAVAAMLAIIRVDSFEELAAKAIPSGILDRPANGDGVPGLDQLPPPVSENEALAELRALADANAVSVSLIGQGYYDTLTPPVLMRNVLENPAWYTAYTPYQPEISQGRLEALLNFQTMVADLTGLEVANASMLDEASAAAEAMTLCRRVTKGDVFLADSDCLPQTLDVLRT